MIYFKSDNHKGANKQKPRRTGFLFIKSLSLLYILSIVGFRMSNLSVIDKRIDK